MIFAQFSDVLLYTICAGGGMRAVEFYVVRHLLAGCIICARWIIIKLIVDHQIIRNVDNLGNALTCISGFSVVQCELKY
jgi:hypothetical protein